MLKTDAEDRCRRPKTLGPGWWMAPGWLAGRCPVAGSWRPETGKQAGRQWPLVVVLVVRALECHQLDFACFVYNVKTQR